MDHLYDGHVSLVGHVETAAIMALATKPTSVKFPCTGIAAALLLAASAWGADDTVRLSYDQNRWDDNYSVFNLAVADQFGTISSSLAASDDPRLRPLTRLDTSWGFGAPLLHVPARIGDTVSSSAFWDQPVRMGGLQLGTLAVSLPDVVRPDVIFAPDVFAGPGAAAFTSNHFIDRVRTVAQFQQQALENAGQANYSIESGRVREDFELRSNDYGSWLTSGTYRYGVSELTTVDGQFAQLGAQQSLVGLGVLEGLGSLGLVSARIANSRDSDSSGWIARMGYDFQRENLSFALRSHIQSSGYQPVGDISAVEPLRQRTLASAGMDLGNLGKVSIASATQTFTDDSRRDVLALSHAMHLAGGGILSTAAAYSPGQVSNSALLVSLTYPFDYVSAPVRNLAKEMDIALDRTVGDALNQTRFFPTTRLWQDRVGP
jgi:outer membrane usher protein FimD/PapC